MQQQLRPYSNAQQRLACTTMLAWSSYLGCCTKAAPHPARTAPHHAPALRAAWSSLLPAGSLQVLPLSSTQRARPIGLNSGRLASSRQHSGAARPWPAARTQVTQATPATLPLLSHFWAHTLCSKPGQPGYPRRTCCCAHRALPAGN